MGGDVMKVTILAEDQSNNSSLKAEHGLAMFIETKDMTAIADSGSSKSTWDNAKTLNVDISTAEFIFLSHGHYDHSGGLVELLNEFPQIPLYLRKEADGDFYNGDRYIGIDKKIIKNFQPNLVERFDITKINKFADIISGFSNNIENPITNTLTKSIHGEKVLDDFIHEQALVVKENGKFFLFSGCAHSGILNILDHFKNLYGFYPYAVFSGFHTMKKIPYTDDEVCKVRNLANTLKTFSTTFYTGHCTGDTAISIMQPILGKQLVPFHCGDQFVI